MTWRERWMAVLERIGWRGHLVAIKQERLDHKMEQIKHGLDRLLNEKQDRLRDDLR